MSTYLISGGAGFIGSNFARLLSETHPDARLVVLDTLTYAGNKENLVGVPHDFVHGDITDKPHTEKVFEKYSPEYVINFAAETHVDRSICGPEIFVQTNICGTQTLLECSKKYDVQRYVQISTDEVYGDLGDTTGTYFTEDTPLAPNCPYAASKAGADMLVQSYVTTYNFPAMITRCTNNYGPYQFPEKLIPFFLSQALQDQSLPLYGDGNNIRDWLYVTDHCRAIDAVLHRGKIGEVYNIGGNNERTNREIIQILLEKIGKSTDLITLVPDRLAHDRRYAMDSSKIQKELGWKPEYPFEIWIEKTIEWYAKNQEWIQSSLNKKTHP